MNCDGMFDMAFMLDVPDGVNVELFIVIFMALLSWGGGLNDGAALLNKTS